MSAAAPNRSTQPFAPEKSLTASVPVDSNAANCREESQPHDAFRAVICDLSRPNDDARANSDREVELPRFPKREPDASVRGGVSGKVARMEAEAGMELHAVGHRRAEKMR